MKRYHHKTDVAHERQGSTLLIVLALLGLLTLLGLIFFTFANQERLSAEYFSAAAKAETEEPDTGFDHGLKHLLVGPSEFERNSILSGRASIVTNLLGNDSRPSSGSGVNVIYWTSPSGAVIPVVDQNRDGMPDHGATWPDPRASVVQLINVVDSPVAHRGVSRNTSLLAAPDNGITYPDQNSMFLSYKGYAFRDSPAGLQIWPVVVPSFVRPGLMRQGGEEEATAPNWYNDFGADTTPGTDDDPYQATNFRPHRSHVFMRRDGTPIFNAGVPVRRFLDADNPADAAIIAGLIGNSGGFPFNPAPEPIGSVLHDTKDGEMGIFTATPAELSQDIINNATGAAGADGIPDFNPFVYELDVDTDDDGVRDGIWLDLDHPIIEDPATGAKYTFMYAVSITDMEGLVNLNANGNLTGDTTDWSAFVGGIDPELNRTGSLSRSTAGMTSSEVNPIYALSRDPALASAADLEQHLRFYGRVPQNAIEAANMEWFWLLMGRPELDGTGGPALTTNVATSAITDLHVGRFGEPDRLYRQLTQTNTLENFLFEAGTQFSSPRPGRALVDDNNDVREGVPGFGLRGLGQPLPFDGSGRWVNALNPRIPLTRQIVDQISGNMTPALAQQYLRYNVFSETGNLADVFLGPNQFHYRGEDGVIGTADDLIFPGNIRTNVLFDDINEGMAELERTERPADEMFGHSETVSLHISNSDHALAGDASGNRVRTLAPWAMDRRDIRERFTTSSNALRNHNISFPFPPGVVTPFGRDGEPGVAGVNDDLIGDPDDLSEVGFGDDGFRAWLFTADTALFDSNNSTDGILNPNGRYEFPPRYGSSSVDGEASSRGFTASLGNALPFESREILSTIRNEDPFRPQLRRLIRMEAGDRKATFGQLPLNINRFLDVERLPGRAADLLRGTLEYRPLTEHVDSRNADGSVATVTLQTTDITPSAYPPRDSNGDGSIIDEMEYWARRDRQKMARDIYVLLYTLGGGNDQKNYTSSNLSLTPGGTATDPPTSVVYRLYTQDQLRQMAQFAVNLVDSLDRDNVRTRFEYDKNLGDTLRTGTTEILRTGWNLDDDISGTTNDGFVPYAPVNTAVSGYVGGYDANFPEDSAERGVVYGVEQQDLSFSETLAIFQREITGDENATLYEDDNQAHAILHIELQNLTTQDVPVTTPESDTTNHAIYRIRSFNNDTDVTLNRESQRQIALLRDAPDVAAGRQYTIATSAGNDTDSLNGSLHRSSDLYVDYDLDGSYDRISPAIDGGLPVATSAPTDPALAPRADVDLVHARDRDGVLVFEVNKNAGAVEGDFLTSATGGSVMFDPVSPGVPSAHVLILERRANPHMPHLTLIENPWVEVDRTYAIFEEFMLQPGADQASIEAALQDLTGEHRTEALQAISRPGNSAAPFQALTQRANTVGVANTASAFTLAQQQLDRDFTSLGELLQIPLYGPSSLTTQLMESLQVPSSANTNDQVQGAMVGTQWPTRTGISDDASLTNPWVKTYGRLNTMPGTRTGGRPNDQALVSGANAKFLLANFPDNDDGGAAIPLAAGLTMPDADNRWYLLFDVLEVTSRAHRQLGNSILNLTRVPGKINPNTLRHPEVLQALLDDPIVAGLDYTIGDPSQGVLREDPVGTPALPVDSTPLGDSILTPADMTESTRDWMRQLIASRDGQFIPPSGAHSLYIPGLPGSRPFAPFGQMSGNDYSLVPNLDRGLASPGRDLENTLLRSLPLDFADTPMGGINGIDGIDDNNSARRLFEVGRSADFLSTTGVTNAGTGPNGRMTPNTRHRLLSKVLNNTTTSSNTFVVHMTIGLFEVYEDPTTGAVRIGGEYDLDQDSGTPIENNRRRSVFLIDRSEIFDAFDAGSGQFDWRRLIKHETNIQ